MNWKKVTIIFVLSITAIIIGYDIFIVIKSPNATISNITMSALWKFPFIAYCWFVIGGHFLSLIRTKKRYIKALVIISVIILLFSFLTAFSLIKVTSLLLAIISLIGFFVGTLAWGQRRSVNE